MISKCARIVLFLCVLHAPHTPIAAIVKQVTGSLKTVTAKHNALQVAL